VQLPQGLQEFPVGGREFRVRTAYYVHGFASSARSTKAALFADRLAPAGVTVRCPDLNEPDFETLTISRMIAQLEADIATLPPGPVTLIGSSLGGIVSFLVTVRQAERAVTQGLAPQRIDRLVLLAPALDFGRTEFGWEGYGSIPAWRERGWLDVFHYAEQRPRRVHIGLLDDAQQYDALAAHATVPTLVFQGRRDTSVDPRMVQAFAASQHAVSLRMVDDDHLLMGSLDDIIRETAFFLGAPVPRGVARRP
jgi:uncharacterized protein